MIIVDANIIVSAIVGAASKRALLAAFARGVKLSVPEPQLTEAASVLADKLGVSDDDIELGLEQIVAMIEPLSPPVYEAFEAAARARLHERGKSDWPVLAAALAFDGEIWSHDRDFFGVGVAIWSTRNMRFAEA